MSGGVPGRPAGRQKGARACGIAQRPASGACPEDKFKTASQLQTQQCCNCKPESGCGFFPAWGGRVEYHQGQRGRQDHAWPGACRAVAGARLMAMGEVELWRSAADLISAHGEEAEAQALARADAALDGGDVNG